jgi:hypothetical protein
MHSDSNSRVSMSAKEKAASMITEHTAVLKDLSNRFMVFHQSNIFFRDIQYGIQAMRREQGMKVSYVEAERLAREFVQRMEQEKIFVGIDRQTWTLRYPEFKTPKVEKPAASSGQSSAAGAAPGTASARPTNVAAPAPAASGTKA